MLIVFTVVQEIIRPGRKVGNGTQSDFSAGFLKGILRNIDKDTLVGRLESIFQPERKIQEVMAPYLNDLLRIVSSTEPVLYKGVSFNPYVASFGENANLLDFFSWIKRSGLKGIVLDASAYAVVNASKEQLVKSYSKDASTKAVEFLKKGLEQFNNIRDAANTRERYLRSAVVSLFPPDKAPLVISAEELWERGSYLDCLQKAIYFCVDNPNEGEPLEIKRYANYNRYGEQYQRWYSVLVLAEALYLNEIYGANIKLGPTSESNFDALLRDFMKEQDRPFAFVWYNREIENEIPYIDRLFFKDSLGDIEEKMGNSALRKWIEEIVYPFQLDKELTIKNIYGLLDKVNRNAQLNLPRLDAEGEWFMTFPPGACD